MLTKELRLQLLRAAVRDKPFLKVAWRDVQPDLFPDLEEQIVARAAASYYEKYEQPIGPLLRTDVEDLARAGKLGAESKQKLRALVQQVTGVRMEAVAVQALVDRIKVLRKASFYEKAIEDIISKHEKGEFNASFLSDLVDKAQTELVDAPLLSHDYFSDTEAEKRIKDRITEDTELHPLLMIDPIDEQIPMIGKGRFGMVLAPPGGGKGLILVHFGNAYTLQGLKVIHFTLEDPLRLVEKRYDCALTGLPLNKIRILPRKFKKRFIKARRSRRGRLRIIDGTDGDWTVTRIERAYDDLKRQGFEADVLLIDYDDEIMCEKQFKGESARRFEFSEIYRRLRKLAAKTNTIVWTAAQTSKESVGRKLITVKQTAEDFSKIRKVFAALTIGTDPEQPRVKYLFVGKQREARANFGVEIVSDYGRAIFYDRELTVKYKATKSKQ